MCVCYDAARVCVCSRGVTTGADGQSLGGHKTLQHVSLVAAGSSGMDATASVAAFASVISGQGSRPGDPVEPVNYGRCNYWMPAKRQYWLCVCQMHFKYLVCCKKGKKSYVILVCECNVRKPHVGLCLWSHDEDIAATV